MREHVGIGLDLWQGRSHLKDWDARGYRKLAEALTHDPSFRERFERELHNGAFLEWAVVHGEHYYGTPVSEVEPYRQQGFGVILDIDVQGAAQVLQKCPEAVTIFLRTSSLDVLEKRLRGRHTETEEQIQRRLQGARRELERSGDYQYRVINDELAVAVAELRAIVRRHFV